MQKLCKAAIFHKRLISRYVFIQKYPQLAIPQMHQQIWKAKQELSEKGWHFRKQADIPTALPRTEWLNLNKQYLQTIWHEKPLQKVLMFNTRQLS